MRPSTDTGDYHTGRGGAGNEHMAANSSNGQDGSHKKDAVAATAQPLKEGATAPTSVADKLKHKLFAAFK